MASFTSGQNEHMPRTAISEGVKLIFIIFNVYIVKQFVDITQNISVLTFPISEYVLKYMLSLRTSKTYLNCIFTSKKITWQTHSPI